MNTLRWIGRPRVRAALLFSSMAIVAVGCSFLGKPAPDDSSYFVLSSSPLEVGAAVARTRSDIHFGIGPVKLPSYLASQSLVVTGSNGSVQYFPHSFWAEPLAESFSRALLYRTGARLGTTHAIAYPWYSTTRVDWKVPVDVLRFEATSDGRAVLVVRWSVQRTSDAQTMAATESVIEEQTGLEPEAVVDGLNRCVERLAETLATAIASSADATQRANSRKP